MEIKKASYLGIIRRCDAPACDILTNKRYQEEGVGYVVVACCPKHAETALSDLPHVRRRIAVAA